jgi:hypothetical protein
MIGTTLSDAGISTVPPSNMLEVLLSHRDNAEILIVGIDAGTTGVRVALHDTLEEDFFVFDFGGNSAGGTRFSFPAVVSCQDDRICFGNEAVSSSGESLFLGAKAALIHASVEEGLTEDWAESESGNHVEFGRGPTVADFLYSVVVARSLELSLPTLTRACERYRHAQYLFTLSAPTTGATITGRRFEQNLASALLLAGSVGRRPKVGTVAERFRDAWDKARRFCQRRDDERLLFIRPEAVAAILPFRRRFSNGDNVLIADVGGTTSDISLIRQGTGCLACYSLASAPIGLDQVDRSVAGGESRGKGMLEARLRRHAAGRGATHHEALAAVCAELSRAARRATLAAVRKDRDAGGWAEDARDRRRWRQQHTRRRGMLHRR